MREFASSLSCKSVNFRRIRSVQIRKNVLKFCVNKIVQKNIKCREECGASPCPG